MGFHKTIGSQKELFQAQQTESGPVDAPHPGPGGADFLPVTLEGVEDGAGKELAVRKELLQVANRSNFHEQNIVQAETWCHSSVLQKSSTPQKSRPQLGSSFF